MKESLKTLSFIFIFILSLLSSSLHAQQTTTVTRVVDGDTLKVRYWGKEESIRLIGIDTPESRVNKKTQRDADFMDLILNRLCIFMASMYFLKKKWNRSKPG